MVGLSEFWYLSVVAYKEGFAGLSVSLLVGIGGFGLDKVAFVYATVVVCKDGRNIQTIGTRHAVLAARAGDKRVVGVDVTNTDEHLLFFLIEWLVGGKGYPESCFRGTGGCQDGTIVRSLSV